MRFLLAPCLVLALSAAPLAGCSSPASNHGSSHGDHAGPNGAKGPLAAPTVPGGNATGATGTLGYYRHPALRGDVIVFGAEGDLWQVARAGGVATRLTTNLGTEASPALSADGSMVAFTASPEGPTEVYTMPRAGGTPVRRTFEGLAARVVGFAPDGALIYASRRYSTLPSSQLVRLDLKTNERSPLPLAEASDGCFTDDGSLVFTRLPFQGSHTKRYEGGTAQNLWKYAVGASEAVPLTADYAGTSKGPMCWKGRIYFLSDRDGTMNLWSTDESGHDPKPHTKHEGWDADQASLSDGRIVYRRGADLRILDLESGADAEVPITLSSDFDQQRETWVKKPMEYLSAIALSPKGDRVALTARGQVFVAPAKSGRLVEVGRKDGVRYRRATFTPDGKSLVALSDESGEVELWKLPANGVGKPQQLTHDAKILRWEAVPSPDGAWIAHHDKDNQLWLWSADSKTDKLVLASRFGGIGSLVWSPDSKWLTYVAPAEDDMDRVFLYNVVDGTTTPVTSDRFDSYSPAWSPDGAWLYFLSDRNQKTLVRAPWGPRQPDPFIASPVEIFAVALKKDTRFPFLPPDELHGDDAKKDSAKDGGKDGKGDAPKDAKPAGGAHDGHDGKNVGVDLEHLEERIYRVPAPAGRYRSLSTDGHRLYFIASESTFESKPRLVSFAIGHDKPTLKTVMEDVGEYRVSADTKKLLVHREHDLYVFDVGDKAPDKLDEAHVDLARWTFSFDPREQWRQMFVEAWRLERDYFYDRGMHGLDWPKVREKYLPLVERVRSREELNDLIAQMVSELSALHIFVARGDLRSASDDIDVGSLGAELERAPADHGYRVARIYKADPDLPQSLSPLRKNGAGVEVDDVIEAINGVPLLSVDDPSSLLRNQAGKQVLLHVRPKGGLSHDVIVTPMRSSEAATLRYDDWELDRRKRVEDEGKGDIGYVHLRAMGGDDYAQWARDFYPVYKRKGLIIDVRHNNGGNIDSWILGKLLRKPWFYWQDRTSPSNWNMQYAFRGHIAVLVDARTASDGEAFAEGIKRLQIGKVIGTRTWGGEIWLSASNVLSDNGIATAAENGVYGPDGKWLIEGHGVEPDMVVDNLPHATFEGKDEQLEAALRYLDEKIKAEPIKDLPPPPFPKKGRN